MPRLEEILRDGPEHIGRSLRLASLRRKLSTERARHKNNLLQLGERAWELKAPAVKMVPSFTKLTGLMKKIHKKSGKFNEMAETLASEVSRVEQDELAARDEISALEAKHDLSQRERNRLSSASAQTEAHIKTNRERLEKLKDDLAFLEKRIKQKELGASEQETEDAQPVELNAARESLLNRLEDGRKDVRKLQGKHRSQQRSLESSIESLSTLEEELVKKRSVLLGIQKRLKEKQQQAADLRTEERTSLEPLREQQSDLFTRLGSDLLKNRSDEPELAPLFSALDLSSASTENLENEIRSESILLAQVNPEAVAAFYLLTAGMGFFAILLITLLVALLIIFL